MKRAVGLVLIIIIYVLGYLSVWGSIPFIPVFGSSMEPALQSGNLLIIKPVQITEVKEGDIIVYNVPRLIREYYNYPPVIAHRVIQVKKDQLGSWLYTKGDNASEDPFLVRPQDIRGTITNQIPYLGLTLLFFQSGSGMAFIAVVIVLLAIFLYSRELSLGMGRVLRTVLSPIIQENYRANLVLSQRFENTEKALSNFASAIELYAQHMASHTSIIQGLSEASQELQGSAAEQNRILSRLTGTLVQQRSREEVSKVERVVYDFQKRTLAALEVKDELEKRILTQEFRTQEPLLRVKAKSPLGCIVNPKALLKRVHYYSAA
jgi:signal peptidase